MYPINWYAGEREKKGSHLLSQNIWRVTNAPNHTKAARVRDRRGQLRPSRNVHP